MSARRRAGRWPDAALAALATLVASWPVTGLLAAQPWIGPTALLLAGVGVVGALARTARFPGWAVIATQLVLGALALTWLVAGGTHRYGLPTRETAHTLRDLWLAGAETVRTETVPATATDGLVFLVVAGLLAVGLAVDALAVTARSPAAAGIPLLVVCTVTASNTGEALHPRYFLATAGAWLLMLGRQGLGSLRRWPTTAAEGSALAGGVRRYGSRARVLGVATALLAVVVPGFLPHLPPTTVIEGLGPGSGEVSFTETLDLSADLASRSDAPVLRYRTDETRPSPLKVAASVTYREGRWHPEPAVDGFQPLPGVPAGTVAPGVDVRSWSLTVVESALRAPQLAVPTPLLSLDVGELDWVQAPDTGTVSAPERPETYAATAYRTVGTLPDEVGQGPAAELGRAEYLEVDPAAAERVHALTAEVTAGATTQLQAARRIQDHLRSSPYVYSLTLADPVAGPDGQPLDPLSNFLETQQGYCTQFATAMVMMARDWGIPARIAVGFLPGDGDDDGTWTVVAADAHAWPELYINGLGWTRFEPTPGTRAGLAPVYYTDADLTAGTEAPIPQPEPEPTRAPVDPAPQAGTPASDGDGIDLGALLARVLPVMGWTVGATALAAAVPLAGWWRRSAALRRAGSDGARIEGHWSAMSHALADLDLPLPPAATPRQAREHLAAQLPPRAAEALGRAATRVERARYAPAGAPESAMAEDVAAVVAGARAASSRPVRLRAFLLPRSGLGQLAAVGARSAGAWQETTRRVRRLVPRSGT